MLLCVVWGFFIGPRRLVVNRTELQLEQWPRAAAPLRVALLSDLHAGSPHWGLRRLSELVERSRWWASAGWYSGDAGSQRRFSQAIEGSREGMSVRSSRRRV